MFSFSSNGIPFFPGQGGFPPGFAPPSSMKEPAEPGTHTALYDVLGVSYNASEREIRKAYRSKALVCHPDKGGDPEEYAKLKNAYDILIDEGKREMYDKFGEEDGETDGPEMPFPGFPFGMPGGMNPMGKHSSQGQRPPPLATSVTIDLEDLYKSQEQNISFTRTIQTGSSRMTETTSIKVHIPAGIPDNHTIRLFEEGHRVHKHNGDIVKGDVKVVVKRRPHDFFRAEGFELFYEKKISFQAALLGTVFTVPSLRSDEESTEDLRVHLLPSQVFYGDQNIVSVPGYGLPLGSGGEYGDLHVVCEIDYGALTSVTMSRQLSQLIREEFPSLPGESLPIRGEEIQTIKFSKRAAENRLRYGKEMFSNDDEDGDGPRVVQCAHQ